MPKSSSTSSSDPADGAGALRGALTVAALFVAGFALAYGLSQSLAPVHAGIQRGAADFRRAAPRLEAVVLGNSHGVAIDVDALGYAGQTLSRDASDPFETRRALQHVLREAPNLEVVYLTVSLFTTDNGKAPASRSRREAAYWEFRDFRPIRDDVDLALRSLLSPVVRPDKWERVFVRRERSGPAPIFQVHDAPEYGPEVRGRKAARRARQHLEMEAAALEADPGLCRATQAAYRSMVAEARRADVRVVLFTPPFDPRYVAAFEAGPSACDPPRLAAGVAAAAPNAVYVDARAHPSFGVDSDLFANEDHLTRPGAAVFSRWLRAEVGPPEPAAPDPSGDGPGA